MPGIADGAALRNPHRALFDSAAAPRRGLSDYLASPSKVSEDAAVTCQRRKQPLASDRSWPGPVVRKRRLCGVSTRTTGFRQGDRRQQDPQSTLSGSTCGGVRRRKGVVRTASTFTSIAAKEADWSRLTSQVWPRGLRSFPKIYPSLARNQSGYRCRVASSLEIASRLDLVSRGVAYCAEANTL